MSGSDEIDFQALASGAYAALHQKEQQYSALAREYK